MTDLPLTSEPWAARRPGESVSEFKLFALYRDDGRKRSIKDLAARLGCKRQTLYNISHQHKWALRISGYEAWLDRQTLSKVAELHKKTAVAEAVAEFHITAMLARNAMRINRNHKQDESLVIEPTDHAQIAELTARQARVGRGDASERTEIKGDTAAELLSALKEIGQRKKSSVQEPPIVSQQPSNS